jgi:hypothetical protein
VRACAHEVGAAELGVGDGELGGAGGGGGAHELLWGVLGQYGLLEVMDDVGEACVELQRGRGKRQERSVEHLPSSFLCSAAMVEMCCVCMSDKLTLTLKIARRRGDEAAMR